MEVWDCCRKNAGLHDWGLWVVGCLFWRCVCGLYSRFSWGLSWKFVYVQGVCCLGPRDCELQNGSMGRFFERGVWAGDRAGVGDGSQQLCFGWIRLMGWLWDSWF